MAEDSDLERTEPATGRQIEKAREKGQVARSRELTTFSALIVAAGLFMMMGGKLVSTLSTVLIQGLSFDHSTVSSIASMQDRLYHQSFHVLIAFLPFFGALALAAILSSIALSGWLFSFEALQPKFGKLNPFSGVTRIISVSGLIEMVKAILKTLLIGGVAYMVIWHNKDAMFGLLSEAFPAALMHLGDLVLSTFLYVSASLLLLVLIDVPFQMWDHSQKLRMTKEEVRQEGKEAEGDPHVKAKIRSMQREMARRRMMSEVPKADVIVTNPTHYAVALRYEDTAMRAPKVVAKGSHLVAQRIMELGTENHVPVLRLPPLARALYRHAELDAEIPAPLYTAVAEVLAYIYQLRHYQKGGGVMPTVPQSVPVPSELDPGGEEA
ncbi:MAG: flagellar biosynthesis protein FlhB [Burkholderiales bacterium]